MRRIGLLASLALCALSAVPGRAQLPPPQSGGAGVVTTCGSVAPFPALTAGTVSFLYIDTNGNICGGSGGSGGGTSAPFAALSFPALGTAAGAEYLASPPTFITGQMVPLQTDVNGKLLVTGAAGGTASSFSSAFPASGTRLGRGVSNLPADPHDRKYGPAPDRREREPEGHGRSRGYGVELWADLPNGRHSVRRGVSVVSADVHDGQYGPASNRCERQTTGHGSRGRYGVLVQLGVSRERYGVGCGVPSLSTHLHNRQHGPASNGRER